MAFNKILKVAIFLDYENFCISYRSRFKQIDKEITIWDDLNERMIKYYEKFIKNDFEIIEHVGTYLCVGMAENTFLSEEKKIKKHLQEIDRKMGFIVKYGYRKQAYKKGGIFQLGEEKGVDSEIICQMLMGAFLNHYDICILMSDDNDYLPVVSRIQDYFGKRVIQAGFRNTELRNQAYGHIPLEKSNPQFNKFDGIELDEE